MAKINADLFKNYVAAINDSDKFWELYARSLSNDVPNDELSQDYRETFDKGLKDQLEMMCITQYVNSLNKSSDPKEEYFEDIRNAAGEDSLYLLNILIQATTQISLLNPNIDIFILRYLISYFKRVDDEKMERYARYLFEQVLDAAESGLEEYIELLDEIFSLGKQVEWYRDFYDQITKLLYWAPVKEETYSTVKKGLVGTTEEVKSNIQEYLDEKYE